MIRAILACDENWGIGKNGGMPWPHNRADLQWFKKMTYGQAIVIWVVILGIVCLLDRCQGDKT